MSYELFLETFGVVVVCSNRDCYKNSNFNRKMAKHVEKSTDKKIPMSLFEAVYVTKNRRNKGGHYFMTNIKYLGFCKPEKLKISFYTNVCRVYYKLMSQLLHNFNKTTRILQFLKIEHVENWNFSSRQPQFDVKGQNVNRKNLELTVKTEP